MLAQVGVGTTSPDQNTVLDVNSATKGMLIPRMNTTARETLRSNSPAQGTMVYDTDLNVMFVFYSGEWYATNPWKSEFRDDGNNNNADMTTMTAAGIKHGNVGIGTASPAEKLEVNGKVKATEFIGNGTTPLGGIIMWSGTTAPAGWALCNGATVNGYKTPDLRGRFIVGYTPVPIINDTYNQPGNLSTKGTTTGLSGGTPRVYLTKSQMPRHNHGLSNHGGHSHGYRDRYLIESGNINSLPTGTGAELHNSSSQTGNEGLDGGNTTFYYVNRTTSSGGSHGHTVYHTGGSGSANTDGSGTAVENRPPYYSLAYIMRVN